MREAWHPTGNRLISVAEYREEFGNKPLKQADNRPRAFCPFCPAKLGDCAGRTAESIGHFAHSKNSGYCPSKNKAAEPFLILPPVDPDPNNSVRLRRFVRDAWYWIYWKVRDLVPYFSVGEFVELIREATRYQIWAYRHFEPWEVPYTLVVLNDFSPATGYKKQGRPQREFWYRFWYATPNGSFSERWNDPHERPLLYHGVFKVPTALNIPPGISDSHAPPEVIRQESDYLDRTKPSLFPFIVDEVERRLPRILQLDAD